MYKYDVKSASSGSSKGFYRPKDNEKIGHYEFNYDYYIGKHKTYKHATVSFRYDGSLTFEVYDMDFSKEDEALIKNVSFDSIEETLKRYTLRYFNQSYQLNYIGFSNIIFFKKESNVYINISCTVKYATPECVEGLDMFYFITNLPEKMS